ncbi:Ldh family oxidoreductase [Celeribacter sp.]|uniref:Ldh family oxidoreductase n=1 Tax=Celeribacter sp. TaxID=1890673 RepID=UPI003A8CCDCB
MKLSLSDARALAREKLLRIGYRPEDLVSMINHLIDCELRGHGYSGLARIVSIKERHDACGPPDTQFDILRETPVSALVQGNDQIGYIVGQKVTDLAIEKATTTGLAMVGGNDTWYTGMLSFYAEQVCAQGLVAMIWSNAAPWVAPYGGTEGRFGTNPVCFGFPCGDEPVIWDIGTSEIIHAQVLQAKRLGRELPDGVAYDSNGNPTVDPEEALGGAFAAWGGHKGSGLAICVQLMGMMAGSAPLPDDMTGFAMVMVAAKPDLLRDAAEFEADVATYAQVIRDTRPVTGGPTLRMPFERSRRERGEAEARGWIEIPDEIYRTILEI